MAVVQYLSSDGETPKAFELDWWLPAVHAPDMATAKMLLYSTVAMAGK
jgi:hypothetical protein